MIGSGKKTTKWMQAIAPTIKKGALRRAMHIKEGETIPTERLREAAAHGSPLMKKRANLALRYRGQ